MSSTDVLEAVANGGLTLPRVAILMAIATVIWVPVGVAVGLRPKLAQAVQPLAQFLAAFPANLLFPIAVYLIVRFELSPAVWLSPLMILGTQWYILFNVIAGASAFCNGLPGGGYKLSHPRLALVAEGHASRDFPVLCDRRHHRLWWRMEC